MSESTSEPAAPADGFYCPGCGQRYPSQTVCENSHPALETKPLGAKVTAADALPAAAAVDQPAPLPEASTEVEPTPDDGPAPADSPAVAGAVGAPPSDDEVRSSLERLSDSLKSALDALAQHLQR